MTLSRRPMIQLRQTVSQSSSNHTTLLICLYLSLDTSGTGEPTEHKKQRTGKHHAQLLFTSVLNIVETTADYYYYYYYTRFMASSPGQPG